MTGKMRRYVACQLWINMKFLLILRILFSSQWSISLVISYPSVQGSLLAPSNDHIIPSPSRCFHDCPLWRTKVWPYFGKNCDFLATRITAFLIVFCVCTQSFKSIRSPFRLGSYSLPRFLPTWATNRKGLRALLMCHPQTFDSRVISRLEVVINSVDNNWVRDVSNYSLRPGSPQSCCCGSAVPLPTAPWLSAWLLCIKCCCSWARRTQKEKRAS